MPLIHLNYHSQALGLASGLFAVVPERPGPHPAVYLLHGLSDDYTIWQRRTAVERYADELGIAVVLLDGGRSFFCDLPDGRGDYERHILESIATCERLLRLRPERSARAIGGLSMGGGGAIRIALRHPGMFVSAHSHSGLLDPAAYYRLPRAHLRKDWVGAALVAAFGARLPASADPFAQARAAVRSGAALPALHLDCGAEDFLLPHNRAFRDLLGRLRIGHVYAEHPGAHGWDYWDRHLPAALRFHCRAFGLIPPP
jgi:S-formylglutathione hydrolase FrmB